MAAHAKHQKKTSAQKSQVGTALRTFSKSNHTENLIPEIDYPLKCSNNSVIPTFENGARCAPYDTVASNRRYEHMP